MRGVPVNKIGTCVRCHQSFQARGILQKYCDHCRDDAYREAMRAYSATYYRRHPDRVKLANKIARAKRHDHYLLAYLLASRAQQRRARERWRNGVLEKYSGPVPKCACCGESERDFLSIDHIAGKARDEREKRGTPRAGYPLYRWLIRNGYPAGFQVLCMNCNVSKGKHGECVHGARPQVAITTLLNMET